MKQCFYNYTPSVHIMQTAQSGHNTDIDFKVGWILQVYNYTGYCGQYYIQRASKSSCV